MNNLVIAAIFILIGLLLFVFSLKNFLKEKKIINNGIKTFGIITGKEKTKVSITSTDSPARIYYIYELTYDDYSGKTIKKDSDTAVPENLPIGSEIDVIYDKEKTDSFLIFVKKQQIACFLMIVLGGIFTVTGILFLIFKTGNVG